MPSVLGRVPFILRASLMPLGGVLSVCRREIKFALYAASGGSCDV
jgi:hypothetical protein